MKLRNKKTGEIINAGSIFELTIYAENGLSLQERHEYKSLSELCEEWEDYEPAEPLIKDEKIRKAVRAWADAWNKNKLYKVADNALSTVDNFVIQFGQTAFIDLEEKKPYTIAELCGGEEE